MEYTYVPHMVQSIFDGFSQSYSKLGIYIRIRYGSYMRLPYMEYTYVPQMVQSIFDRFTQSLSKLGIYIRIRYGSYMRLPYMEYTLCTTHGSVKLWQVQSIIIWIRNVYSNHIWFIHDTTINGVHIYTTHGSVNLWQVHSILIQINHLY